MKPAKKMLGLREGENPISLPQPRFQMAWWRDVIDAADVFETNDGSIMMTIFMIMMITTMMTTTTITCTVFFYSIFLRVQRLLTPQEAPLS